MRRVVVGIGEVRQDNGRDHQRNQGEGTQRQSRHGEAPRERHHPGRLDVGRPRDDGSGGEEPEGHRGRDVGKINLHRDLIADPATEQSNRPRLMAPFPKSAHKREQDPQVSEQPNDTLFRRDAERFLVRVIEQRRVAICSLELRVCGAKIARPPAQDRPGRD